MKTLYIYEMGAVLSKQAGKVIVQKDGIKLWDEPMEAVEAVVVAEHTQITGQLMTRLMEKGIPVHYVKKSGAVLGSVLPNADKNIFLRVAQYDAWRDPEKRLAIARCVIKSKIRSQQAIARKYQSRVYAISKSITIMLDKYLKKADGADSVNVLSGIEGASTNCYYDLLRECFSGMPFTVRSRRPPGDEVNALLSLSYMTLLPQIKTALTAKGFDAGIAYLHSIQPNRDSLALDFLETYRARLDNMVINWVNRLEFTARDFERSEKEGYLLHKDAFRRFTEKFRQSAAFRDDIERYAAYFKGVLLNGEEMKPWITP